MDYVIKKKNKNKKISKFKIKEEGYEFKPNIRNTDLIKISSLIVYNQGMIEQVLVKKIDNSFRKLTSLVFNTINDDADGSGVCIALNELTKVKSNLMNQYKAYIKKNEYDKYMKRLNLYQKELKDKLIVIEEKTLEEEEIIKR